MNSNSTNQSKLTWDLEDGRTVRLSYTLSTEFDIDEIIKIDINNLMGEYLTAPVLFNTIANLRSEAAENLTRAKMQLKYTEDYVFLQIIKDSVGKKKPTNLEIEASVTINELVVELKEKLIKAEKDYNMIDNLYWSMKIKCEKLEHMYHKIIPEDFKKEIMEGQINNILIKIKNSLIK